MGWRFRKSFTVIPGLKLNLSSRGLSTTIGAPPFSVNIGPKGVYRNISIPGTGISHRERINTSGPRPTNREEPGQETPQLAYPPPFTSRTEPAREIHSAKTELLTSDSLAHMRELLTAAYKQREELKTEVSGAASDSNRATERYEKWSNGFLLKHMFKKPFAARREASETAEAKWKELQEQLSLSTIRTEISLEPKQQGPYSRMIEKFSAVAASNRIWNILSERSVNRVAERTNVNTSVDRTAVTFSLGSCDLIQLEESVPNLRNKTGGDMFIYPGFILYRDSNEAFALIDFRDVTLRYVSTQFTEREHIPSDSRAIGLTWNKCNKDGSPDRRFRDNYHIPIALYGGLNFSSRDGLDVRYLCSNATAAEEFVRAWIAFQMFLGEPAWSGNPAAEASGTRRG